MPRNTSPVFVLAHPADDAGCGHHRIKRPVELLSKAGYITGQCSMNIFVDDRLKYMAPDVVIWQRQHEEQQIANMAKTREIYPPAFHVYEIDDCLSAVPEWSPHKPFIMHDVDKMMVKGIRTCDAITVSTKDLADHVRSVCPFDVDIRIVPNMLGKDELARVSEIRTMKPGRRGDKLRIGWAGGNAHKGDLDLIIPAMRELHNRVEFVFLGMKPECEVPCEFHNGVPPTEFLSYLAGLGLDLILAPLVDCKFNRCKSNLRLVEAGAIGVPVVASPVAPYKTENPPVYYAESESDWTNVLARFIGEPDKFLDKGSQLHHWVNHRFVMDNRLEERLRWWLPNKAKPFVPKRINPVETAIVVCPIGNPEKTRFTVVPSLEKAFALSGNIVYVRPGTLISDEQINRILQRLKKPEVGSVVPLSNDGGIASFPQVSQFTSIEVGRFTDLDTVCKSHFADVSAELSNPAGPVIAISRRAMEVCGYPDLDIPDIEASLMEWGVMSAAKGFTQIVAPDVYVVAMAPHSFAESPQLLARCQLRYQIKQLPPDPLVDVRRELEFAYHKDFYRAPMPSLNAAYIEWSALFNELGEADLAWMNQHIPDVQIKHFTYPASTEELRAAWTAGTRWALFTAASTTLAKHALYVFAEAISESPLAVVFYADHDTVRPDGSHDMHDFKPERLDRHLLLQRDYLTPVFAIDLGRLLADRDLPPLLFEAQFYGYLLDILETEATSRFVHIPRVLASLAPPDMMKLLEMVQLKCGQANSRTGKHNVEVSVNPRFPFLGTMSYRQAVPDPAPKVSVVMPTGGKLEVLSPCLYTLFDITDYPNFEVLVIENGPFNSGTHEFLTELADRESRLKVLEYRNPYNWSELNNWGVRQSDGEYVLFLNDDTRILEPHWLREMVGAARQDGVGAVGARLIYPHGLVQHVGVVCRNGMSGHLHKGISENSPGYNGIAVTSHEATAVTGACLLMRRDLFDEVGGLDEELSHNFNDVLLCLELGKRGFVNVVAAQAQLHHLEGFTRISGLSEEGMKLLQTEGQLLHDKFPNAVDPYWNDNLFFTHSGGGVYVSGLNCDILQWPPKPWPHRQDWPHESVLIIGDDGSGWVTESRKGNSPYFAMMHGFSIQITRPVLVNVKPFDIRQPEPLQEALTKLGITKIVLRSLLGGMVESLPFFQQLGLPIEYRPFMAEAVCPRLDFKTLEGGESVDCRNGWKRGFCQNCVSQNGSPFGVVSILGWRDQWRRFLTEVEVDELPNEQIHEAVQEMYPEVRREAAE